MNNVRKGKLRVKKLEKEKMLNTRTTQRVLLHKGCCFTKGATLGNEDRSNEKGHKRDEGEYEKDESRR